jgi:branched-chain amino acid transport system substrate-binding protein
LATSGATFAPAIAQNRPVRIGILAPRSGIAAAPGENGIRAAQWAAERFNAAGGIAGRKIELVIEEETSPKDTIERFSKLVQQEKVDCVQGIISTGVGLALGPVVEEARALTIYWDGTTQDGVDEKIANPHYLFRSTDNECEAVMSSLLAIKYWRGKFVTVAGINPDYSYGRNNMAGFIAILNRFNIEHKVVTEQWPKVGTMDLTSHVAALKSAKPDLIFSSLLFADLPVFMKQAHAAELTKDIKLVLPAAGWQHTLMKKEFTPEGVLFGHNTFYFDNPNASPLAKEFVAKSGSWQTQNDVIDAMVGLSVESLGGKGSWRKDHIAEQTFVQGLTTHNNKYDFVTLGTFETMYAADLQKPPGANFWDWIKTAQFKV